jgi:hypothetical protein
MAKITNYEAFHHVFFAIILLLHIWLCVLSCAVKHQQAMFCLHVKEEVKLLFIMGNKKAICQKTRKKTNKVDWFQYVVKDTVTCLDRPLRLQEVQDAQISSKSAHEASKVSSTHRLPLPSRRYSWYSFLLEAIVRPEGLRLKNNCEPTGNRTRDLPPCSAVPQPTAPP